MDFELEKILAKVSGENVEHFSDRVISNSDKVQIDFALKEIFSGLTVIEWLKHVILADAWRISLDTLRDYVFSLTGDEYAVDYLHHAVFDHRRETSKLISSSVHANEYMQYSDAKRIELEQSANEKIKNGVDILKNILATPNKEKNIKQNINRIDNVRSLQNVLEIDREHERTKK